MELRIVCDNNGNTNNVGTISSVDAYTFYAKIARDGRDKRQIKMALPVGGDTSGLYRFPRIGEKVLVDKDTDSGIYYLLGYVPGDNQKFSPGDNNVTDLTQAEVIDKQGQVFRYKNTNEAVMPEKYSEIGFYNKETHWSKKGTKVNFNDMGITVSSDSPYRGSIIEYTGIYGGLRTYTAKKGGVVTNFNSSMAAPCDAIDRWFFPPKIDHLNIQSAGDIHSSAQNHHRTKAKRFELLVDCEGPDYTKNPDNYGRDDWAFGDRRGDDPNLYAGDAHIRAKNRIIIKAGDEIQLEVGRSSIVITDSGIIIQSRKLKPNILTPGDTMMTLTPIGGVDIFGQHVKIKSALDFSLGDSYGGELSGILGVMRIISKDFKAQSSSLAGYMNTGKGTLATYAEIIFALEEGIRESFKFTDHPVVLPGLAGKVPGIAAILYNVYKGYMDADGTEGSDPVYGYCTILRILSGVITGLIPTIVEAAVPKEYIEKIGGMDAVNTAVCAIDLVACSASFVKVCIKLWEKMIVDAVGNEVTISPVDTSFLHLTGSAGFVLDGRTHKKSAAAVIDVSNPSCFAPDIPKTPNNGWKTKLKAALIGAAVSGGATLVGTGGVTAYECWEEISGYMEMNQKKMDELKDL
jgi:hypothetical protein